MFFGKKRRHKPKRDREIDYRALVPSDEELSKIYRFINPPRGTPLEKFKNFIDGLVADQEAPIAKAVRANTWNQYGKRTNEQAARLLSEMTDEQRQCIADRIQEAFDSGICTVLNYLDINHYVLTHYGVELARHVYGHVSLPAAWHCRRNGEDWPKSEDDLFSSHRDD